MLRALAIGDLVPKGVIARSSVRRLDATALLVPGRADLAEYRRDLERHLDDFAAWDGRIVILEPDGEADHLLVIVDRYGQVYETNAVPDASGLPPAEALEEWFRFLATACPECGVLDDPRHRDWTP